MKENKLFSLNYMKLYGPQKVSTLIIISYSSILSSFEERTYTGSTIGSRIDIIMFWFKSVYCKSFYI